MSAAFIHRVASAARIVDSHTGGEPTRVVVAGGPDLGHGPMIERLERFRHHHDHWRRALVNEPRGSDVLVGALLCQPVQPANACGVIFFNNAGYLGMCGHGTIGLIATLAYLGRIGVGEHRIETPVGLVGATLHEDGSVTVLNVPSYRHARAVVLQVPGHGEVRGDVAWGGNWFFLCEDHGLPIDGAHLPELTARAQAIRRALQGAAITGADGAEIDHVELIGPPRDARHHGRSFVLCPGGAYDRSPCGTGTSAKLACLAADGKLGAGEVWHQESVIGSVFGACYQVESSGRPQQASAIRPQIRGRAHVTLDAQVLIDADDPFAWGLDPA